MVQDGLRPSDERHDEDNLRNRRLEFHWVPPDGPDGNHKHDGQQCEVERLGGLLRVNDQPNDYEGKGYEDEQDKGPEEEILPKISTRTLN